MSTKLMKAPPISLAQIVEAAKTGTATEFLATATTPAVTIEARTAKPTHWCQGCDDVMLEKDMRWAFDMFLCRYCWHDLGVAPECRRNAFGNEPEQQPNPTCSCALCGQRGHWDGYPGGELCLDCVYDNIKAHA